MSKIIEQKEDKNMFGIEVAFYALGFISCLILIAECYERNIEWEIEDE